MDRLTVGFASMIAATLGTSPLHAQQSNAILDRWNPLIAEAAARFDIPAHWIRDVMAVESGGRTELDGHPITSTKGAMGLMQVMPGTYSEMRLAHDLGADPYEPRDNILAGTAYLKAMHERFGWPGLFAAYNAGPGRYEAHIRSGQPLPDETIAYLAALDTSSNVQVSAPPTPSPRPAATSGSPVKFVSGRSIFFVRNGVRATVESPLNTASSERQATSIFVTLLRQRP